MTQAALAHAYKADGGRVLAALIAQFRDFDLAEEALQDAMIEAARVWPKDGTPSSAGAWLLAVARRRALDRLRKSARAKNETLRQNIALIAKDQPQDEAAQEIPDERLRLIFTCCHPALAQETQVALNRAVAHAHAGAPKAALSAINALEPELKTYQPFHAARAELLAQCEDFSASRHAYLRAIELTSAPEAQAFLRQKLHELP